MIDGRAEGVGPDTVAGSSVSAICVQPIGADLVAATAFDTLARKMDHGGVLSSLTRETVWLLTFDCETGRATSLTAALAATTGIFVNPNTHRHVVVAPQDCLPHGAAQGRAVVGAALWLHDDPEALAVKSAVRERMGVTELTSLMRLTLWWFGLAVGAAGARSAGEEVGSMVVTRSRTEGLLANPHSQGWYLVESPHTPAMMLRVVEDLEAKSDQALA